MSRLFFRAAGRSLSATAYLILASWCSVFAAVQTAESPDAKLISGLAHGNLTSIVAALEQGADPDLDLTDGTTPLTSSAMAGNVKVVNVLLKYRATPNKPDKQGYPPLVALLNAGRRLKADSIREVATSLLRRGANPDGHSKTGYAPLNLASDFETISLLVTKGAKIDAPMPRSGITPLMMASGRGDTRIVKFLLDHRALVNAKDRHGRTALSWAISQGKTEVARLLRAAGARQ